MMDSVITSAIATTTQHFKKHSFCLYEHQAEGIQFMLEGEYLRNTGGILADDMGLGKTIQSAGLIHSAPGHSLVITPSGVLTQWMDCLTALLPPQKFRVILYHGPTRNEQHNLVKLKSSCEKNNIFLVVVTTHGLMYAKKRGQIKTFVPTNLHDLEWTRILVDEAHYARNSKSLLWQGLNYIQAPYKWLLTGTPIQNSIKDIVSLFVLAKIPGANTRNKNIILEIRDEYLLRRTKEEIAEKHPERKLPELEIENLVCPFISTDEEKFYELIEKNAMDGFKRLLSVKNSISSVEMLELLIRLRQAAFHPQLVIDGYKRKGMFPKSMRDWEGKTTKLHMLETRITEELQQNPGQKTIIFCQFTQEIEIIQEMLHKHDFTTEIFAGDTDMETRRGIIHGDISPQFLLIQIKSGGCGLNLQKYHRVYFTSPDWNPANEFQAIARAHRNGQRLEVKVTRLLLQYQDGRDTIDQRIFELQKQKAELAADIMDDQFLLKTHKYNTHFAEKSNYLSKSNFGDLLS
jgi:SNF2 family DNA or RNA helicase